MIAFGWRQFRGQAIVGAAGLVLVALVLAVTGPHLVSVYDTAVAACKASGGTDSACNNPVMDTFHALQIAVPLLVLVVPVLIGMFWGAPIIARELESGTFRLAWTQSVSRLRWLLVKLGLVGLASMVAAGGLSLMVTWWASPLDKVSQNRFSPSNFALHGFVPAGYAVFAFALGAAAGLLIRRTLPAMVVDAGRLHRRAARRDLLGAAALHESGHHHPAPVEHGRRVFVHRSGRVSRRGLGGPDDSQYSQRMGDRDEHRRQSGPRTDVGVHQASVPEPHLGRTPPGSAIKSATGGGGIFGRHTVVGRTAPGLPESFRQCFDTLSAKYHEVVTYQPASRFWTFQTMETALFVLLALAVTGGCAWWVRHRIS